MGAGGLHDHDPCSGRIPDHLQRVHDDGEPRSELLHVRHRDVRGRVHGDLVRDQPRRYPDHGREAGDHHDAPRRD